MAVRALAVVAFLLVGHDVLMTSPAAAHETGLSGEHVHAVDSSTMTMTMGATEGLRGQSLNGGQIASHHPTPTHEDSDCGVVRKASMPSGQSLTASDIAQDGAAFPFDVAAGSPVSLPIRPDARAPTISPRTRQAMLQIFRV